MEVIDAAMKDRYRTVSQVDYTPGKLEILKKPIGMKALDTSFLLIQATARETFNAHCKKAVRPLLTARRLYGFYDHKLWHTGETEYDGVIGRTGWEMLKSGYKNDAETTPTADNELPTIMH
ncbi:hypothetical protein R5R35_007228 [Gryllus longicercus]|uniref:Uncharacterized protein n=1 Tax=Gryllus longicercus TaxID=2509291 RepID=A0AAN9VV45_9ORTH|nr:Protein of unknown function [Gryllus bimaculatus]